MSIHISGFFVFVVARTGYCVVGCCRNLAKHREGRHDLPLIYEGVSVSTYFSADGWRVLWSFMETEDCMCLLTSVTCQLIADNPSSKLPRQWQDCGGLGTMGIRMSTPSKFMILLYSFAPKWLSTIWSYTHTHLHTKGCPTLQHFDTIISISNTPDRRTCETGLHFHPQCTNPHINLRHLHKLFSYSTRPRRMGTPTLPRRRCHDNYSNFHTQA